VLKTTGWSDRGGKIFFSPDGKYLAYSTSRNRVSDVFVLAVDGSRETAVVSHESQNDIMGWSPDGKYLLFASNRTGVLGLWMVAVGDGKAQGVPMLVRSDIGSSWSLGVFEFRRPLYVENDRCAIRPDIRIGFAHG
jgi:Tol biopolymer transport system component